MSIRDAAYEVMDEAYMAASNDGSLPAKPRQIMYAARPEILRRTGRDHLDDRYFTQTLLPDYVEDHDCGDWDIVWDARASFIEPHTNHSIQLGTLEVRGYLGLRPPLNSLAVEIATSPLFPTVGPENRYQTILFIEKEGFGPLLEASRIAERFDLAVMSTKGMSTTAARMLLDHLARRGVDKILVLRDFDISGFSIRGTLGTDSRRYCFASEVPIVDLGLRLADVRAMGLLDEPVAVENEWQKISHTLARHGAIGEEIKFLRHRRVELNAITSRQFIEFIEQKLEEHGVRKVVPGIDVIRSHARCLIEG